MGRGQEALAHSKTCMHTRHKTMRTMRIRCSIYTHNICIISQVARHRQGCCMYYTRHARDVVHSIHKCIVHVVGMQLRTCSLSPDMLYEVSGREMLTSTSEDGLSYSLYTRTYCRSIPLTDSGALQLTRTTSSNNCEVLTAETGPGTTGETHKKKSMPAWTQ